MSDNQKIILLWCLFMLVAAGAITACQKPASGSSTMPQVQAGKLIGVVDGDSECFLYRLDDAERGATLYILHGSYCGGVTATKPRAAEE